MKVDSLYVPIVISIPMVYRFLFGIYADYNYM